MNYVHKNFECMDWEYYTSWLVFKEHRAFIPPSPPTVENSVDLNEEEDGETPSSNNSDEDTGRALFQTPATQERSRGPGGGAKKTKAKVAEDDYRTKKTKLQEGLLEVQKEKADHFASYVNNQARAQAFKMAVMGYNTFKNDEPAEAQR